MKIALIGQSSFASSVYTELVNRGHEIVAIFTVNDKDGREDRLAEIGKKGNSKVFKFARWMIKKQLIAEIFDQYKSVNAELNVMPYCTQFIPMEIINYPKYGSICYHPSLLPRHRGASAINWTLIDGDDKAGFTVFWPDDGLDTGPILLQRECPVDVNDTVDSLYNSFLFPEGVKGMADAVDLIAAGKAPKIPQSEIGASYDEKLGKPESCLVNFDRLNGKQLHNFVRGMDKVPGASIQIENELFKIYSSQMFKGNLPEGKQVTVKG